MKFNFWYFISALILFTIEAAIALYVHDQFIRPYVGDVLVVALIYCFAKSFIDTPIAYTAIGVMLFAYTIEVSQYFHLVYLLGWGDSRLAKIVMGTQFVWGDFVCYTAGAILTVIVERIRIKRSIDKVYLNK